MTFAVLDRALIAGFLDHMSATRGWRATTYNQRLACIRSFFHYAATAEPTLAMHLADITGVPQKKTVVREQPDNERPASAPARTTKRMEDVMRGCPGR